MTTEPLGAPTPPEPQRRVAVIPLALAAVGVVVAIVLAAVVFGLAGAVPSSSPSPTPSIPPPAATPAPAPSPTAPARVAGPNECADARGDGSGIDLDSIGLSADGNDLRIVFVLTDPLPESDATLEVYADGGQRRYQLAIEFDAGQVVEFFAYRLPDSATDDDRDGPGGDGPGSRDEPKSRNGNGPGPNQDGDGHRFGLKKGDVEVDGTVIIATVGKRVLEDLGDSFLWYAFATVNHDPADACYREDGSLVPFER